MTIGGASKPSSRRTTLAPYSPPIAYPLKSSSTRCKQEENAIKARCPSTTASNPITPLPATTPACRWMAILFKGASATGEHGKGTGTTGCYCGARFVVSRFYKFAGIKRKNAVCLDVRARGSCPRRSSPTP